MTRDWLPRVTRRDIRFNVTARFELKLLVAPQSRPFVTVIDWWSWYTIAESGAWDAGDAISLLEGPLNPQHSMNAGVSTLRDNRDFRALDMGHPTGGVGTDPVGATAALTAPFHSYAPGGIMTTFEVFIGAQPGAGVLRLSTSIGWHSERLDVRAWDSVNQHSLNTQFNAEPIEET